MAKDDNIKTRKSLFGKKEITTQRYKNPKTGEVRKSKDVKYKDGSSKSKVVEKKPGLFGRKTTTTTYSGKSKGDVITKKRHRLEGVLPRVKTYTEDKMMGEKDAKTNLFYKLGSKRERAKLKKNGGVVPANKKKPVQNCLKGTCKP
jgi:hypothetical protein